MKIDLVLFDEAIEMIVKINRIIQSENSHALLMGFGGSGKRSSLKLAAFMQDYNIF